MFIRLEKSFDPLRAQIAAGVLRAHGIAAWVSGDVTSSSYGSIASGGCTLMVEEAQAEEAVRILEAQPEPQLPALSSGFEAPAPLRFWRSLGYGFLQGMVWLPVLALAFVLVLRAIAVLRGASTAMWGQLPVMKHGFLLGTLYLSFVGAVIGTMAGLAAWLLSSYRHRGRMGYGFVLLMILSLVLIELIYHLR